MMKDLHSFQSLNSQKNEAIKKKRKKEKQSQRNTKSYTKGSVYLLKILNIGVYL